MAFIKYKHHLLIVYRQVAFCFHQVIKFLNSGDDNFVIVLIQISFKTCCIFRAVNTIWRKTLIFLHGLVIEVFPVDHEEDFINKVQFRSQTCGLKAGQGFSWPCGMPDKSTAFGFWPVLRFKRAVDFPENALGGGNLIGAHDEQRLAAVKHAVIKQNIQQSMLLEESGGKVLQVLNQSVIRLCPVHGEIKAVFIPLSGTGKVPGISPVGNHEELQVFKQGVIAVKAFLAVTVYLVKGFTNRHAALFEFDLHQWQAVDQNCDIIAVSVWAGLFKLLNDLHLIAQQVLFIYQIDVFQTTVIKREITDIVDMDFTGFIQAAVTGAVEILLCETPPFTFVKHHTIKTLKLVPHIRQHRSRWLNGDKLIALIKKVLNQLPLKVRFALVAVTGIQNFGVFIKDDKVIGFSNGVCLLCHGASCASSGKARKGIRSIFRYS